MFIKNLKNNFYSNQINKNNNLTNLMQFNSDVNQRKLYEKEQHRIELMQQIEENKHRKMLEKQKEIEIEERDRAKFF